MFCARVTIVVVHNFLSIVPFLNTIITWEIACYVPFQLFISLFLKNHIRGEDSQVFLIEC